MFMVGERRIFVGSSREASGLAGRVGAAIEAAGLSPVLWNVGAFPAGRTLLEQIERFAHDFEGAVLVATPDVSSHRGGRSFEAPVANVVFEYGYLSARLTRSRVAICRFGQADLPSDILGVKLVEGGDPLAEALPPLAVAELRDWLEQLPRLADEAPPTRQAHGYSGRWRIETSFTTWRGITVREPDSIFFRGEMLVWISVEGRPGTGILRGSTFVSVSGYSSRFDVADEIRSATVDSSGGLTLRLEVISRHLTDEQGEPPHPTFRDQMQAREFEVRLEPVPGVPGELHGWHRYTRGASVFSAATERYMYADLA
jgi:hypothetical protein